MLKHGNPKEDEFFYSLLLKPLRNCILYGDFILSNLEPSSFYIDLRDALCRLQFLDGVTYFFEKVFADDDITSIISFAESPGSMMLGPLLSYKTRKDLGVSGLGWKPHYPGFLKVPMCGRIPKEGDKPVVVDDLCVCGEDILETCRFLKDECKCNPRIFVILERAQEARKRIEKCGFPFFSILTFEEILDMLSINNLDKRSTEELDEDKIDQQWTYWESRTMEEADSDEFF